MHVCKEKFNSNLETVFLTVMFGEAVVARRPKAILLCSGGLDSIISLHFLVFKGIEVIALLIITPFCNLIETKAYQSMMYNTSRLGVRTKIVKLGEEDLSGLLQHEYVTVHAGVGSFAKPILRIP